MTTFQPPSDFFRYLANQAEEAQLPSLKDLSIELGVSVATLREQMEVARAIGLVEVRPHTGMRRRTYSFTPAVHQSLTYAVALDVEYFNAFADLRNHIEAAYWDEAVNRLIAVDHQQLRDLLAQAWEKLRGDPVIIPHQEHKQLHLCIYSRLDNPFVQGLLEAYWEMYEAVGLNLYADYAYLTEAWEYHQRMVESICTGNFASGLKALLAHRDLLYSRNTTHT